MASILKRGKKYRALVRKKGMLRCHTFQTKSVAKTWAIRVEAELDLISSGSRLTVRGWTVGDVIDRYIEDVKPNKQWGVDKDSALKILKTKLG
jgi:hypothetical protein